MAEAAKIIYTETDEAPFLATHPLAAANAASRVYRKEFRD